MIFKKLLTFGFIACLLASVNVSASESTTEKSVTTNLGVTFDLCKRTALVTGGTSGIGLATARLLVKSNCNVVIVGRDPSKAKAADDITKNHAKDGVKCLYINADVSKEEDVKKAIKFTVDNFGSIDFLVCSAGIGGSNNAIADETLDNWQKVLDIDLKGTMLFNKYAIQQMQTQGTGGAIVNVSSMFGLVAVPSNVAYSAAKGAVCNMTKACVKYASEGIRVNCVCPGVIDTPLVPDDQKEIYANIHPTKRIGTPDETAYPIVFLLSDASKFTTGACIAIDGGYTAI